MFYDIVIIGGGAAGLMAAYGAASSDPMPAVMVLEKMPRPGRKIMITGKGRCNFTNLKDWNDFSQHIRTKTNFLKPAFYNLNSQDMIDFFNDHGMETVVERGDRAFPKSYHASEVVDTLMNAATRAGAVVRTDSEVKSVVCNESSEGQVFMVACKDGRSYSCRCLIIATGGLSYPGTGSTGDGYAWARYFGHTIKECFPSLTALVPKGYKMLDGSVSEPVGSVAARVLAGGPEKRFEPVSPSGLKGHVRRDTPLSEIGKALCGIQLKNVGVSLWAGGNMVQNEMGDIDFTDGGIEGPIGFTISRNCVKAIINGGKAYVTVDMKPGVEAAELKGRIKGIWNDIQKDPRSRKMSLKDMLKILLGKLMPWDLIPGFVKCNPSVLSGKRGNEHIDMDALVAALKEWRFDIEGYVGYERCVVTAGGVSTEEVVAKTMESRIRKGLYLCGEVLDIDSDTGGYNLQTAFSTGYLAGMNAAKAALAE